MSWCPRAIRCRAYFRCQLLRTEPSKTSKLIFPAVLASCALVLLAACGPGAVDCSSRNVKGTVLSLFQKRLESNISIFTHYLVENSETKIMNIRTVHQDARGVRCLADLATYFVARPEIIAAKLRESGTATNPVAYNVQLTDDNRPYVTLR